MNVDPRCRSKNADGLACGLHGHDNRKCYGEIFAVGAIEIHFAGAASGLKRGQCVERVYLAESCKRSLGSKFWSDKSNATTCFLQIDSEAITVFSQQPQKFRAVQQRNWFVVCKCILFRPELTGLQ